eukprot:jgi/Pico_ML_1/51412/g2445.t2
MLYDRLAWATMFEHFLSNKFTAAKRFGLEGAETLIPGMKSLIDKAAALGVDDIVFGMPHRGRLNVLANVVRKPLDAIFAEFHTGIKPSSEEGQGVVYETFDMSALPDYEVGGTIHIVVNNQVAFTTDPYESRSSAHCTDVAKTVSAPIFHVNGDDAEAVCHVMELAAEYRQRWKKDVVIDLVCYRN